MIQLQVLNKILSTKDYSLVSLNNLTSEYFSSYVSEFEYIKTHVTKYGQVPDIATFLSVFPDFELLDVQEKDSFLLEELVKDRNTRHLAKSFNSIRSLLMENKVDEAMDLYKRASETLNESAGITSVDILRDTSRYDAYIERTKDFDKFYVSTGFKELDAIMGGWDREEELATIVARPGVGKSWFLLKSTIASVEQGLRVGLYSGEMSERKVGYRLDTLIGHVSNGSLMHGNIGVQPYYERYIKQLPNKYKGCLKVLTPTMINRPATVSDLRAFVEKEKLDILFVDQHSLLDDERRGKTPIEKAANISRDLKNLQVLKKIPIISASQQNRTTNENGADTAQIAQSDRIGQDSTCVIFIERSDDIVKLRPVKLRDSASNKTLSYQVDFNVGEFIYIPEEGDEDSSQVSEYEHRYEENQESVEEDVF